MFQLRASSEISEIGIGETTLPGRGLRFVLCLFTLSLGSCAPLTTGKITWDWGKLTELQPPKPKTPDYMVDIWTDTVLTQPGQPAIRGLGGRILFYQNTHEKPVVVDGTLTVYVFEEKEEGNFDTKPACKYVFLPEHLSRYYSRSALGHSYSIWIPFDEAGSPRREVMLLARFEDARSGKVIVSKPVRKSLPGPASEKEKQKETTAQAWYRGGDLSRPDSNASPSGEIKPSSRPQVESTTIDLPPAMAAKILGVSQSELPQQPPPPPGTQAPEPGGPSTRMTPLVPEDNSQNIGPSASQSLEPGLYFQSSTLRKEEGNISGAKSAGPVSPLNFGGAQSHPSPGGRFGLREPTRFPGSLGGEEDLQPPGSAALREFAAPGPPGGESADPYPETIQTGQRPGNRRPPQFPAQRGPVVVPSFSPGRTQPHPVVWPSRPPGGPQWFLPHLEPTDPEAAGLAIPPGSECPNG
mgnify:FL=1